jgi:ATP-dependent Clp protease adaptor protein ClpS
VQSLEPQHQSIVGRVVEREPVITQSESLEPLWRVIIYNDDITPYDYVIKTLGDVFMLSEELAEHIAWTAHTEGKAVVVVRPRREAERLVGIAHARARRDGFPLTFSLEQD